MLQAHKTHVIINAELYAETGLYDLPLDGRIYQRIEKRLNQPRHNTTITQIPFHRPRKGHVHSTKPREPGCIMAILAIELADRSTSLLVKYHARAFDCRIRSKG